MPKSKELLESDDSYDSDEVKPRAKKQKVSTKKESAPAPTAKNGKKKTEEDEDNENEDTEEVDTKPGWKPMTIYDFLEEILYY